MSKFETALRKATDLGHTLEKDPIANFLSDLHRHVCKGCGRAVVGYENGTNWGAALEELCDAREEAN